MNTPGASLPALASGFERLVPCFPYLTTNFVMPTGFPFEYSIARYIPFGHLSTSIKLSSWCETCAGLHPQIFTLKQSIIGYHEHIYADYFSDSFLHKEP
jgi:hypothetical protein